MILQRGRNITPRIQISDEPGLLSELLAYHANILTIHQTMYCKRCGNYFFVYRDFSDTGDLV